MNQARQAVRTVWHVLRTLPYRPVIDDKRVRAALYLAGGLASAIIVGGGALDETSPAQIFLSLILVVLPISFVTLVIPALIRIGDNRPPAVQFVARPSDLSAGWYPDQQNPAWIRWQDGTQRTRHVRLETTPTELLIQTRCISAMKRTLITLIAVACLTAQWRNGWHPCCGEQSADRSYDRCRHNRRTAATTTTREVHLRRRRRGGIRTLPTPLVMPRRERRPRQTLMAQRNLRSSTPPN